MSALITRRPSGLTFTDVFCGAGGSSLGLTEAGLELVVAANHWVRAIETHQLNFPNARHECVDVNHYDMRNLNRTRVAWFSPICTEASPSAANTGRRTKRQVAGQEEIEALGHVPQAGYERTRATFHDVIRATEVHRYDVVIVENVPQVAYKWELFDWWCEGMMRLGYRMQILCVSSAHIGDEDNDPAAQWRNRMYMQFTRKGVPEPDLTPTPRAWCPRCETDVAAVQWWKPCALRVFGQPIGKYRDQYTWQCPRGHAEIEPYVRSAASIIDWSDLGPRIGDRASLGLKKLVPATIARIDAGLAMMRAREREAGKRAPIPSFVTELRNHATASPVSEPLSALTTSGRHHYLTSPPFDAAQAVAEYRHGMVVPYRKAATRSTAEPLLTLATHDSAALGWCDSYTGIERDDLLYRMLTARENLRGQRFPDSYPVCGNDAEQTAQAGNAVSVNVARFIGNRIVAALS